MKLFKNIVVASMIGLTGCAFIAGIKDEKAQKANGTHELANDIAPAQPPQPHASSNASNTAAKMIAPLTH